ncbi:MAG: hypothetical protein HY721_22640 [Planctomycetes bacterium]|nr:hypothetical protein [Planctomycetota bacterium]
MPPIVTGMTVIVGLAVLCLVAWSLFSPREPWAPEEGAGLLARMKKRRDRLLRSMKDLESERESGLITEDELRSVRNELKGRAIAVTRDLERVRRARLRGLMGRRRGLEPSERKRIEQAVRERAAARAAAAPGGQGQPGGSP